MQRALWNDDLTPTLEPASESLEALLEEYDVIERDGYTTLIARSPATATPAWIRRNQHGFELVNELRP